MNDEHDLKVVFGNIDERVFWASRNEIVKMLFYSTTPMSKFLELSELLDKGGRNILYFHFIHNDDHLRSGWLVKFEGIDEPQQIEIEIPLSSIGYEIFKNLREIPQETRNRVANKNLN